MKGSPKGGGGLCPDPPPPSSNDCSRTEIRLQLFSPGSRGAGQRFAPPSWAGWGISAAPEGDSPPYEGPGGGFAPFHPPPRRGSRDAEQPLAEERGRAQPSPRAAPAVTQFRDSAGPPPTARSREIKAPQPSPAPGPAPPLGPQPGSLTDPGDAAASSLGHWHSTACKAKGKLRHGSGATALHPRVPPAVGTAVGASLRLQRGLGWKEEMGRLRLGPPASHCGDTEPPWGEGVTCGAMERGLRGGMGGGGSPFLPSSFFCLTKGVLRRFVGEERLRSAQPRGN